MPRGLSFRTARVRDPAEGVDASMSAPIASTATGDVNGGAMDASGPARMHPTTADGELAESQSHRKPELREGARRDDAGNSARDASSEPEDPVERFAVMRALETLRDDDAEPHERTSACERLRDFARATPVLAERHREMQGLVETCLPILARVFHPFPRAASDGPPRDDADVRAAALRAYIAAAYRQRETDDDDDDDDDDGWRKTVRAVDALAATATQPAAPEDVAARVSALDVIGRCAGEVRGIFAHRARGSRGDSDSRGVDPLDERSDERFRATVEAVVRAATSATNDDTDEAWAAAMECACRLGPHYVPGDASSALGAELVDRLESEDDRVAGSAARIAGKLRADVIERSHVVDALVALTASEGRAAWVRHAAAVAVGRAGAARDWRRSAATRLQAVTPCLSARWAPPVNRSSLSGVARTRRAGPRRALVTFTASVIPKRTFESRSTAPLALDVSAMGRLITPRDAVGFVAAAARTSTPSTTSGAE